MRLIVAEVVIGPIPACCPGEQLRPEGTTWYPDARVFVLTAVNTPNWRSGDKRRRSGFLRRDRRA